MATSGTTAAAPESSQDESAPQIVVVDIDEAQPARLVKLLRKGRGKLMARVERVVADLGEAGTIKSGAQPIVIVVRETPSLLGFLSDDDDED